MLEGVVAIRRREPPQLIGLRLDTVCHAENDTPFRPAEGTVEQLLDRLVQRLRPPGCGTPSWPWSW